MKWRENLLKERERIKTEYNKRHKIWMDAFNRKNDLLPEFHNTPDGVMATFALTMEYLAECDKADKEEREASLKLRETLKKIWEINTKLQP